ncbi:MAG TPA: X-Pro aminopeptidase [Rhodospirillaceae bacterium]|nr:X-Pro aminopeptidase [Rhodospirillaceae bacterium]
MNQSLSSALSTPPFYDRLQALRDALKAQGLDGFLVPMADEYQNEYVAPQSKRIKFLTGFSGSAGFVIVLMDRAIFFTDSRYTLQAGDQLPQGLYTLFDTAKKTPSAWLEENLLTQMVIGFDPRLHTARQIERYEAVALKKNATLKPLAENPIDALWTDRPQGSLTPITVHDIGYAGKASVLKRHEIAEELKKKNLNAAVITDPASVAWLLNVRGGDVSYTPLPLSTVITRVDGTVEWFVDPRKVPHDVDKALGSDVTRYAETEFPAALKRLGEAKARVMVDPEETAYATIQTLRENGAALTFESDPCALPRACKNNTEIDGMRAAHRRDGAALVKLMAWIDQTAPQGGVSEIDVEQKLTAFREQGNLYQGPSFATIAGSGPNGAIVHYRAVKETTRQLDKNSFLLLDSGAQYLDGTTDVTRTIPLGTITPEMRDRYTRVLKGHIALAAARFPEGTSGADLDVLARQYLWEAGLDYGHGTGHGVGCYLCVHEGPQGVSRRGVAPLCPNMVLSNEPGYYKPKHYGIRLENLQYVVELFEISNPDMKMLGFEPLTLAPFDRRAIDATMLTSREKEWLNAYHARVCKALRPQLDETAGQWLIAATAPL